MADLAIAGAATVALDAITFSRSRAPGTGALQSPEAVEQAAEEFEAQFIGIMLNQMFANVKVDGLFGGGEGEEMFRSLLVDQYGEMIAEQGGLGLADQVKSELLRLQEG